MRLLIAIAIACAFSLLFQGPIKKKPVVFYVIVICIDVLFLSHVLYLIAPLAARAIYPYIQRCLLAYGLFVVVMFIGVLPHNSAIRRRLAPIRAELSIIAALLTLGHIGNYVATYVSRVISGFTGLPLGIMASFATSIILVVLLTILTMTSFDHVKKSMGSVAWKKVQKLAYVFFALIYLHLAFVLAPAVSPVGQRAFASLVIYSVITVLYVVLRVIRAVLDKRTNTDSADADIVPDTCNSSTV